MRVTIFISLVIALVVWIGFTLILAGVISIEFFHIELPKNTAEFGDSMGLINGLFSSFAVILALVTVLFQGKELRESTLAQEAQAQALRHQIEQQQKLVTAQLQQSKAISEQLEQQQI